MGLFWDLMQQSQISDQRGKADDLDARVRQLDDASGLAVNAVFPRVPPTFAPLPSESNSLGGPEHSPAIAPITVEHLHRPGVGQRAES